MEGSVCEQVSSPLPAGGEGGGWGLAGHARSPQRRNHRRIEQVFVAELGVGGGLADLVEIAPAYVRVALLQELLVALRDRMDGVDRLRAALRLVAVQNGGIGIVFPPGGQ